MLFLCQSKGVLPDGEKSQTRSREDASHEAKNE